MKRIDLDSLIRRLELLAKDEPFFSGLSSTSSQKKSSNEVTRSIEIPSQKLDEKLKQLKQIEKEVVSCKNCSLHTSRTKAVPGEGSYNAKVMIIGEAPGREEDIQGRPFVGKAGQLLTKLLSEIDLSRNEVYITNIVKCRPPENRQPSQEEAIACNPFLRQQLEVISPKVVVLLGATASKYVIGEDKITKIRGKIFEIDGIIFLPTLHPAAVLRNESQLPLIREDFEKLREILKNI